MKEKRGSKKVLFMAILLALVAVPLLVAGVIWAQEGDLSNDRADVPETPDLIIDDPEADVPAIIADSLDLAATPDSVVIPAADFRADRNVESDYFAYFIGGYIYSNNASGVYCGMAPLYLPDGVTINAFTAYVYDTYSGDDIWVDLLRKAYGSTTNANELGTTTTSGTPGFQAIVDNSISNPVVDNDTYVYYVTTCFGRNTTGSGNRLYAVQVFYTQ